MANIVDYLAWRGDLTFAERPFNDVDNVILATLSYLDFSGIVPGPGEGAVSLSEAAQAVLDETGGNVEVRVRSLAKLDPALLWRLASSRRYGQVLLHDCVDELDQDRSLQFAALQADVTPSETYVSFRGTDSTLVGWREDFMLSFTITEAQREATRYLERALAEAQDRGRHIYVGGHSKGGNLAVYAALSCPISLQPLIARVWSNDGPGLAPEIMPVSPAVLLGERYRRIVPAYDMVGILFERQDDPRQVVASSAQGARQHDPFTWQVTPFGMDEVADLLPESKLVQEAIDDWVSEIALDQRAVVVDQFFDALEAGGAHTLSEVLEGSAGARAVLTAMGDMDDSTKELLRKLAEVMLVKTVDAMSAATLEAAQSALTAAREAMAGVARHVDLSGAAEDVPRLEEEKPQAEEAPPAAEAEEAAEGDSQPKGLLALVKDSLTLK